MGLQIPISTSFQLPDGRTVKVRPSNDAGRGRYTIDIIKKNNRTEREIRYGKRN